MPGHSRSKDGVASLAYRAGHPRLAFAVKQKTWMAGTSPAMTGVVNLSSVANLCSAQLIVGRNRRGGASRRKNFKSKTISISDACAAVANQFADRA
jgi:hypothetical protein